jgi:hypothetical protein
VRAEGLFPAAPEVECIGKGKARWPYEFGGKVSIATTLLYAKGGQFVTTPSHHRTPPRRLGQVYAVTTRRRDYKFGVFISGQGIIMMRSLSNVTSGTPDKEFLKWR